MVSSPRRSIAFPDANVRNMSGKPLRMAGYDASFDGRKGEATLVLQLNQNKITHRYTGTRCVRWPALALIVLGSLAGVRIAAAQAPPAQTLTLSDAIELARKNYPAINEVRARADAAEQGVAVARTSYLPRLDLLWQANRATHNNVFGLLFPQGIVPPISGPVLGTTSYDGAWGSAGGLLLAWQ